MILCGNTSFCSASLIGKAYSACGYCTYEVCMSPLCQKVFSTHQHDSDDETMAVVYFKLNCFVLLN